MNECNKVRFLLERIIEFEELDSLAGALQFKEIHEANEKSERFGTFYEERLDPMQIFYESAEFGLPFYNIPDMNNVG